MRLVAGLLFVGLTIGPAVAQNAKEPTQEQKEPTLMEQMRAGVSYENCVARCEKCGSGRNPDCVKNFCAGPSSSEARSGAFAYCLPADRLGDTNERGPHARPPVAT
jgi:hypothetical protein